MNYYAVIDTDGKPRIISARLLPHIRVICRSASCSSRAAAKRALRIEIGYDEKHCKLRDIYKRQHRWCIEDEV